MMQFTEEQRKALIVSLERRIKNAKRWLSSNKSIGNHEGEAIELISIYEIALAAMEAKPVYQVLGSVWRDSTREVYERCLQEGLTGRILYTAPPVAALRLPDEKWKNPQPGWESEDSYPEGWNACLAEVKRLNITAPAEDRPHD